MLKSFTLAAGLLFATAVSAQHSLQSMHARVPVPPASSAAAAAWLVSPELVALRREIKEQRVFVEKLMRDAGAAAMPAPGKTSGGIDFQRAQRDPEYAKEIQAKIAGMSQQEQMKLAMDLQKSTSEAGLKDVQAMAGDSDAVKAAAEHYADYQSRQMTSKGITLQSAAVDRIRRDVMTRAMEISDKAARAMKCSDGEGGCASPADEAADKATRKAAYDEITAEFDNALVRIRQQVEAARKARFADIAAAQRDLEPAKYGAAAQSSSNRQLLATYHNTVLIEIEQLLALSEDTARWATRN